MYRYYKEYIIREGNNGVSREKLRELYESVEWVGNNMPKWMNEKFEVAMENSAWAFTVWENEEIIAMVRVISDKVMMASVQDLIVKPEHQKKGIGRKLLELCREKLPYGMWFAHTTPENYEFYKKSGFGMSETKKEATMIYNGYSKRWEES